MTWIVSIAHAHPVAEYLSIGAVLSVALGTFAAWMLDGELNGFCLFLLGMVVVAWPIIVVLGVLAVSVAIVEAFWWLLEALWAWCSRRGFKPLTWVFAWPYKVAKLIGRWRFRRKVRKMIEKCDTSIIDEDTGIVGKEQE